jgi:hypothetical protein
MKRWRCLWTGCPQYGQWHTATDPVAAANRHYLRHHWNPQRKA